MNCPPSPGAIFRWIAVALHALAVISAWLYAKRKDEHRSFALWISVVFAADMIGFGLHAAFPALDCAGPEGGFRGVLQTAFFADSARYLVWPISLAWLSVRLFGERERGALRLQWPTGEALAIYIVAVAGVVFGYPFLRGESLRRFYLGAELVALLISSASIVMWARRGAWRSMTPTVIAGLSVVLVELAMLAAGPWSQGFFGAAWIAQNGGMIALYGVLAVLQGAAWHAERSRGG